MKRTTILAAAALLSTSMFVGGVAAETQAEDSSRDKWRVVLKTGEFPTLSSGFGGLDSYPVAGDLEDCRRIAEATGKSFPPGKYGRLSVLCLNTETGVLTPVGEWKF